MQSDSKWSGDRMRELYLTHMHEVKVIYDHKLHAERLDWIFEHTDSGVCWGGEFSYDDYGNIIKEYTKFKFSSLDEAMRFKMVWGT